MFFLIIVLYVMELLGLWLGFFGKDSKSDTYYDAENSFYHEFEGTLRDDPLYW